MTDTIEILVRNAALDTPPRLDLTAVHLKAQHLRRRRRATVVSGTAVLLGVAIAWAGFHGVGTNSDPARKIEAPAGGPPSIDPSATPSVDRPVLDQCTPTQAIQRTEAGAPFSVPVAPFDIYADPALGPNGPLVAVAFAPGPAGGSSTDGNTGGLMANSEIGGRDLTLQPGDVYGGSKGGARWDTADGRNGILYERLLDADQLRAVVEALDRGDTTLPGGLQKVGTTGRVERSQSTCLDNTGLIATVMTFRGDAASRWAFVLSEAPSNVATAIHDDGATSTISFGWPGRYDPSNATYHEATPAEWERLLAAAKASNAVAPSTTRPPSTSTVP